ncbi:MAG: IS5 family transposase, partial [Phocaeicola sp.]
RITEFETPFETTLDSSNRWVRLANELPWNELCSIYNEKMSQKMGARATDARVVIGALIVKHRMKLSDIDTIEYIRENMYVQYFLGLHVYTYNAVFDPSLFVHIRKRLGLKEFEDMTTFLMKKEEEINPKEDNDEDDFIKKDEAGNITHKGSIKIDATALDAEIKYPTDLDLLNSAREKSEKLIDKLCAISSFPKPRMYRRNARKDYLSLIKKKAKGKKLLRKALRKQLAYLSRNIGYIHSLFDSDPSLISRLSKAELKYFWVIQLLYDQQKQMYDERKNSCSDRIVSIHQPHVRPIVRGKSKGKVEFGAKVGVCVDRGYSRIDHLSWNAYNESEDLSVHLENYKAQHGFYPYRVLGDKIYLNRQNRTLMKDLGIEAVGAPLGRPSKESKSPEYKAKMRKAAGERNEVEGSFGVAKRRYDMNDIRARLSKTAESWIAVGFFVLNLQRFLRGILCAFELIVRNAIIRAIKQALEEIITITNRICHPQKIRTNYCGRYFQ